MFSPTRNSNKKIIKSMSSEMGMQLHTVHSPQFLKSSVYVTSCSFSRISLPSLKNQAANCHCVSANRRFTRKNGIGSRFIVSSSVSPLSWDEWKPEKGSKAPSLSDVIWPAAGAFAAMALMGRVDQILAPKGVSMTIAPFGAVCAVLFTAPSSPSARKYNIFMAQIGCAALGVLAFVLFGPGWLARSAGLAAAIAFMIYTRAIHPPAASLPILFIDGLKLHHLNYWYAFFPGAAGCIILCLIQEMVSYLKENFQF